MKSRQSIGLGLSLALILTTISIVIPMTGTIVKGSTLYVGGGGPGNYTTIQDAVLFAINGDTIFVYSGIYNESVGVIWSLSIIGENKETTFINGQADDCGFSLSATGVTISGFTIMNFTNFGAGISLGMFSNNCNISNNIIKNNGKGISFASELFAPMEGNIVYNNLICDNDIGIYYHFMLMKKGHTNSISQNNSIINNIISNNTQYGVYIDQEVDPTTLNIYHNSFYNNGMQAYNYGNNTRWDNGYPSGGNYWSDYNGSDMFSGPGQNVSGGDGLGDIPYVFPNTQDNYPLMSPFVLNNFNLTLQLGWNLISLPLIQDYESIDQVLSTIDGKWDCIQAYDALDTDHWKSNATFKPDQLNDLKKLNHKMGFWINITQPGVTLTVSGYVPTFTSIPLYAGWNLVGYPSLTNETIANALWGTGADKVEVFDPVEPYQIRDVGASYVMKPGEGYWVHVPADTVWVVDW